MRPSFSPAADGAVAPLAPSSLCSGWHVKNLTPNRSNLPPHTAVPMSAGPRTPGTWR